MDRIDKKVFEVTHMFIKVEVHTLFIGHGYAYRNCGMNNRTFFGTNSGTY